MSSPHVTGFRSSAALLLHPNINHSVSCTLTLGLVCPSTVDGEPCSWGRCSGQLIPPQCCRCWVGPPPWMELLLLPLSKHSSAPLVLPGDSAREVPLRGGGMVIIEMSLELKLILRFVPLEGRMCLCQMSNQGDSLSLIPIYSTSVFLNKGSPCESHWGRMGCWDTSSTQAPGTSSTSLPPPSLTEDVHSDAAPADVVVSSAHHSRGVNLTRDLTSAPAPAFPGAPFSGSEASAKTRLQQASLGPVALGPVALEMDPPVCPSPLSVAVTVQKTPSLRFPPLTPTS